MCVDGEWKLELLWLDLAEFSDRLPSFRVWSHKDPWQVVRACFMRVPKLAIKILMPIGKLPRRACSLILFSFFFVFSFSKLMECCKYVQGYN